MTEALNKIISDLLAMRRDEAAGIMVMANSDDTMFEDCIRRLKELSASRPEGVTIKVELLDFLSGIAPLDGVWFGDEHPKYMGKYWWRRYLPDAPQDESPPPMNSGSK